MSQWHEAKTDCIDFDLKEKEVNIFVTENDYGNVYVILTFSQIKNLYKTILEIENATKSQP